MGWYPIVAKELQNERYEVHVPHMPGGDDPKPEDWIATMHEIIGKPDEQTYLIGHSLGPTAILRYLEQLKPGETIGGALFVAGGFHYTPENEPENLSEDPWYGRLPDFSKIKPHLSKSVAMFSDDDPLIVLSDKNIFEKELASDIRVYAKQGHFIEGKHASLVLEAFRALVGSKV